MNLYEHTIIAKQDVSPTQLKQLTEKYSKIVEKLEGELIKTENWGLLDLSYIINKNKKGNYIHFKIKGESKIISELEKNEKIDKNLLRYLTVKVKKLDTKLSKEISAKYSLVVGLAYELNEMFKESGIDDKFRKALNNVVKFSYDNFEPEMVVFLFKTIMKDYQIRFNVRTDLDKELHKTFSERYTKYIA